MRLAMFDQTGCASHEKVTRGFEKSHTWLWLKSHVTLGKVTRDFWWTHTWLLKSYKPLINHWSGQAVFSPKARNTKQHYVGIIRFVTFGKTGCRMAEKERGNPLQTAPFITYFKSSHINFLKGHQQNLHKHVCDNNLRSTDRLVLPLSSQNLLGYPTDSKWWCRSADWPE